MNKLEGLRKIIDESTYTVCLSGYGMLIESGYPAIRDGFESYDIELKYGYSTEEIFSSSFYSTRKEKFFEFYRNEILSYANGEPSEGFYAMARLEARGKAHCTITRRIYGLPSRAGCKNVINLHGSVYDNFCEHCGKTYPMEYIMNSKGVPRCEKCGGVVRPRVCLFGEMVNNEIMSMATQEVSRADVLLVLGTNLKTYLCERLLPYFGGSKVVLINKEEHFSDRLADFVIHDEVKNVLPVVAERF